MNFEEDDLRFLLEAVKEAVITTYKERAEDMETLSDTPQNITSMRNYVSRLERVADNIEKELDKSYFN